MLTCLWQYFGGKFEKKKKEDKWGITFCRVLQEMRFKKQKGYLYKSDREWRIKVIRKLFIKINDSNLTRKGKF